MLEDSQLGTIKSTLFFKYCSYGTTLLLPIFGILDMTSLADCTSFGIFGSSTMSYSLSTSEMTEALADPDGRDEEEDRFAMKIVWAVGSSSTSESKASQSSPRKMFGSLSAKSWTG